MAGGHDLDRNRGTHTHMRACILRLSSQSLIEMKCCNIDMPIPSSTMSHQLSSSTNSTLPHDLHQYFPSFPASSPYVTAVGGTQGPDMGRLTEVTARASISVTDGVITRCSYDVS